MFIDILLLQMLFSCSTPLNKLLLEQSSVLTLTTFRMFFAGCFILFSWLCINKKAFVIIKKEHVLLFGHKIVFGSYLKYVLKYWGLQYMNPAYAAFLFLTTPLWAAFFDYIYFNQRFTTRQYLGMIVTCFAILPLLVCQQSTFLYVQQVVCLPAVALLCAVGVHCYGVMCTKKLIMHHGYDPILISAYSNIGTGILAFLTLLAMKQSFVIGNMYTFMPYLLILIFISNIVGKVWHTYLLKKHSMTILSLSEYINPLYVALYSWLFWGISIRSEYFFSGLGIFFGLYLFHSPKDLDSVACQVFPVSKSVK